MTRKLYLPILAIVLCAGTTFAQLDPPCEIAGAYVCDNFDAYADGDALGPGASWWTTWSGSEGEADDGEITSEYAHSGTLSMLVEEGGIKDILLLLGNQTSGVWRLEWQMYIPTGKHGYYNIQEDESPGVAWNLELQFGMTTDGEGEVTIPATGTTFSYPNDAWFTIRHVINLDADIVDIYVDNVLVTTETYTGSIGSVDFYSIDEDNRYYIDDVLMLELTGEACSIAGATVCDNIDTYTSGDAVSPFADWWTTWSSSEGGEEDGTVSSDYAYSGLNSVLIPSTGTTDLLLLLGNQTSGTWELKWQMYIPAGAQAYYNVQEDETPGVAWNLEVYFGLTAAGEGEFTVPSGGPTFSYPENEWFTVQHIFDLDADLIEVYIDGELVLSDAYTGSVGAVDYFSFSSSNFYYIDDVLLIEEGSAVFTYYEDADDDTYGNATSSILVSGDAPDGYVSDNTDCDDTNPDVYPGATEVCNGIDDNCVAGIDEGLLITYYADTDGDTYGDAGNTTADCSTPSGYVSDNTDCDDSDPLVNPGATEIANGIDDDCDEQVDEGVVTIQDVNANDAFVTVYPIPTNGNFILEIGNVTDDETLQLEISNAAGQLIYSRQIINNPAMNIHPVSLTDVSTGVYTMKLTGNATLLVKQFVVQ